MKTAFAFLLLLFIIPGTKLHAQKFTNASDYFQFIGKEFKQVSDEMWDYTSAAAHGKRARAVENKRKELISQISSSIVKVKGLPPFEGNKSYRDSVVSYLQLNKMILNHDYAKIVDMEEVAEQSYDAMEAYMLAKEMADEKQERASDMVTAEEKKFAEENNITLVENPDKVARKLAEAGKVYKYYNEVYLIFFKSYKQEIYMIDAQKKGNFNAMEQNKNALIQTSAEGKTKLAAIAPYKGDNTVKAACLELLNFYEKETAKFNDIANFYIQKEKFDKIKASIDAKSAAQRTQSDIDQYNAAVNEFNNATNKYNAVNQELNQTRTRLIDKWNSASDNLIDKFVPKRK